MDKQLARNLITAASDARKCARVPLSDFHVGAALLTKCGTVITGCNTEQGNMYESICAERCAITKAVSLGFQEFAAIAVVSDAPYPLAPCGLCRQALIDYGPDLTVIMSTPDMTQVVVMRTDELMPAYDLSNSQLCKPFDALFA